jgi:hypothetical protein
MVGVLLMSGQMSVCSRVLLVGAIGIATGCAHPRLVGPSPLSRSARQAALRHAQVWLPTDVASMDIRTGPVGPGSAAEGETLFCDYVSKKMNGKSPKFTCRLDSAREIKVKYGRDNGEVYGEVAATRLLWALGFGADWMYPVRVACRGCPPALGGRGDATGQRFFDVAAVEHKMPGHAIVTSGGEGWSWTELDIVDESAGGAPRSQVDALKLLAALLQHTDSKPEQQRLVCLEPASGSSEEPCRTPFLMISDLGLTFGRANIFNQNSLGSVNFERWAKTNVWKDRDRCVANLSKSATGTLENPAISEAGRSFLADLLQQLTDRQLRDLFEVARFDQRPRAPHKENTRPASIDEWLAAFKQKREEILGARCPS